MRSPFSSPANREIAVRVGAHPYSETVVTPEPGFPRRVQVRDDRGWHDGWVKAARRDPVTGRWRGYVDYVDHSDLRTGGHYIQWADQDRIRPRQT